VLTEPTRFDGSLEHLQAAAQALCTSGVPAMRKDFLVDPYQVLEARVAGAGGVLVILRMLGEPQTGALLDCARDMGLFVLLEAFDEADIERAHAIVARHGVERAHAAPNGSDARAVALLVGLNCRDLDTLQVVPGRLEALATRLPRSIPRVAESGVGSAADAASVAAAGYDLALVGSALMTGADPAALARDMLAAGRSAATRRAADRKS
jgi:indole-3-glycerol phosphate synthase